MLLCSLLSVEGEIEAIQNYFTDQMPAVETPIRNSSFTKMHYESIQSSISSHHFMGIMHSKCFQSSLLQPKCRKVKVCKSDDKRLNHISSESISLIHDKPQSLHEKCEEKHFPQTCFFFQAIKQNETAHT